MYVVYIFIETLNTILILWSRKKSCDQVDIQVYNTLREVQLRSNTYRDLSSQKCAFLYIITCMQAKNSVSYLHLNSEHTSSIEFLAYVHG